MTGTGDTMRILIADDSALLRQRVSAQLLQNPRVSVVAEACDTQETLALIETARPDAVVLDLSMPGGGGIAVLEALRERPSRPAVIVLTNHVLEEYRERCLALGAAAFLDKSGDAAIVSQVIQGLEPRHPEPMAVVSAAETVELLPIPGAVLDETGTILVANSAWRELVSAWPGGPALLPGADYLAAMRRAATEGGSDLAEIARRVRDALAGGPRAFTLTVRWPAGGDAPWVRVDGKLVGVNGATRLLVIKTRVTDAGQRMDVLSAKSRRPELPPEHVPDIVFRYRLWPDQEFEYLSPAAMRITGYSAEDLRANPHLLDTVIHPDDEPVVDAARREPLADRRPFRTRVICKDGSVVWMDVHVSYVRDATGRVVAVEGVARDVTVERETERVMRLQAAALDAAANGVVITDRTGAIEWVNPAFTRLTGYEPAEVVGRNPSFLKSGEQNDAFYRAMWRSITAGEPWRGELTNRRKDGTLYAEEMQITPVRDLSGAITHFIAIKEDVSERNAALSSLRYSEGRFRAVADSASDAIIAVDASGRIVYWNRVALERFGYEESEIRDVHFADLLPDLGAAGNGRESKGARESGAAVIPDRVTEGIARRRDGTTFPAEVALSRVWTQGAQRFFSAVIRDVTERRQAEAALRESEARFRGTFEQAAVGISHVDFEGRFVRANRRFAEMLGYSVDELLTMRFQDVTAPDDMSGNLDRLRDELLSGRRSTVRLEKRYLRSDGRPIWVKLTSAVARDAAGAANHLINVMEDVTEQRLLREQLNQAQKMEAVGRLAGGVAHDFNNLLTIIRGEAELAIEDLPESAPLRESLLEIKKASDRAALLTRQLLAFSRKQIVEKQVFSVNRLVTDAEKMLGRLLEASIHIELDLAAAPDLVEADPAQVEQVLMNLVVNARDAMPHGGTLTVTTQSVVLDDTFVLANRGAKPGSYVLLAVSDSGTGMHDEVKQHLFEPFFTTKPGGQGTGLGLATCFGIVKQADGYIAAYSEQGVGTTMKVYLPRSDKGVASDAPPIVRSAPTGSETVVVVEDEDAVRRIARRILAERGYTVLEAASAEEGLALLAERPGPVHLLLSDVVLPDFGGRELAIRAQRLRP
ncbi:MAG: PAS domain S-box protein, partial [Gemmatimonadota bacterium]|nr:PAS domain S-box protein [Gemmatimonadota bacterium]